MSRLIGSVYIHRGDSRSDRGHIGIHRDCRGLNNRHLLNVIIDAIDEAHKESFERVWIHGVAYKRLMFLLDTGINETAFETRQVKPFEEPCLLRIGHLTLVYSSERAA